MTKQEEIRKGIAKRIYDWYVRNSELNDCGVWEEAKGWVRGMVWSITDILIENLHSQGVVLKVDWGEATSAMKAGGIPLEPLMELRRAYDAGFTAWEPLIKVKPLIECEHEWVSARNKVITSGEFCPKCMSLRAEPLIKERE